MAKICSFDLIENTPVARDTYSMVLVGDTSAFHSPGQFVNISLEGCFLRRPISICSVEGDVLNIVYKVVGRGTRKMSLMTSGQSLNMLTGLGNGFDTDIKESRPVLIGGSVGAAPMYALAKKLINKGMSVSAVLGFNSVSDVFLAGELSALGASVSVTTADGSMGVKGFVTDVLEGTGFDYVYACGPVPMLKAVYDKTVGVFGQYSLEARMACGFGACMACTCDTSEGARLICKDGPVFRREEIKWETL